MLFEKHGAGSDEKEGNASNPMKRSTSKDFGGNFQDLHHLILRGNLPYLFGGLMHKRLQIGRHCMLWPFGFLS
jgi:hypothetical protein